jgi:hypothetical protein
LIPRNPDDEEAGDFVEYSADDLLLDGGRGSREKEQAKVEEEKPADKNGLLSAIQQYIPPPTPPFVMEVVEAQARREVSFDPVTGRPMSGDGLDTGGSSSATDGTIPATPVSAPTSTSSGNPAADAKAKELLDNFPVNFN